MAGRTFPLPNADFEDFLEISVRDSGIGIAEANLALLFSPFTQIDGGLARKFEGTGLGLALVKLLVELHGGTVAVESGVNEGSCFTVWLPVRALQARPVTPLSAPTVPARSAPVLARTALVVDDDYKSAELVRVQLETHDFVVLHAPSAEAALVLAAKQPLALITLDIMLPNMNGWQFLEHIRKEPSLGKVPVIIISIESDLAKGQGVGVATIIQKPLSREALNDALTELRLIPTVAPLVPA